jgi:hypothetical protein
MKTLLILVLALMLLAAPVRAAHIFKAERGNWGRSVGVLVLGALLVNLILNFLPSALTSSGVAKFLATLAVLTLVSQILLYIKAWQALVIALFLTTFYSIGEGDLGTLGVSAKASASIDSGANEDGR